MYPIQGYLGKQLYKCYAERKIGMTSNNPRQNKGVKATCDAPSNCFKKGLVMTIFCHASLQFFWIYEMLFQWVRLCFQAFSCVRLSLYGCAHAFYGCWHKVQVSSAPPTPSSSLATLTFPVFGSSAK